jgi:FlaA1/EpsC-like NDP-sugar epimerase
VDFDLNKLLDREPVKVDLTDSLKFLKNKRILITGAGGSIGSELCRQMLFAGAKRLFLFGHGEDSIYHLLNELTFIQEKNTKYKTALVPVIGELQDKEFMKFIIECLKCDVIFHTAAHKHVPLSEENPVECIKNNVFGTKNLIDATKDSNISKFIFISSDKAVEPSCIYGVSKNLSERIVFSAGKDDHRFVVVRFGNVIGSKGSAIPLWIKQIEACGPITITHPEVKRFFMSITEAVSLIIKITGNGRGGELYALNMGNQVLIKDLLTKLTKQACLDIEEDIEVKYIGLRAGEKLEERLWAEKEEIGETAEFEERIFKIIKKSKNEDVYGGLHSLLQQLYPICFFCAENEVMFRDRVLLRNLLKKYYPKMEMTRKNGKAY